MRVSYTNVQFQISMLVSGWSLGCNCGPKRAFLPPATTYAVR
jgi:hypothetical protein